MTNKDIVFNNRNVVIASYSVVVDSRRLGDDDIKQFAHVGTISLAIFFCLFFNKIDIGKIKKSGK